MTTVLLAEDNPDDTQVIRALLTENDADAYHIIHVERLAKALEHLRESRPIDIIIADIALPDSQGAQSFQKLRSVAADKPVIFCTGTHDEDMAASALQRGAQDYLLKGQFDGRALRRAIRYAIERKKFQIEAENMRRRARRLRRRTTLLKQQQAQLITISKAKDDFISLASHQLRTPATGVKQYLGLLIEGYAGSLSDEQCEFLYQAYDSNERQLKIVSDLLRTAQLDAGEVKLKLEKVPLDSLIREIVDEQTTQIRARRQQINIDFPNKIPPVRADASKLRMALENLIDNASKYTPEGKGIFLSLERHDDLTAITIRDEGVGISPDNLQKIFEKFSRISNFLSERVGGSGLGLYWVKKIVDLHNGHIRVVSSPGQGTRFVIELP